jgi:hypothetical protein
MLTLTPQARAVLAFTLALLALIGWLNRPGFALYVMFGGDLPGGDGPRFVLSLLTVLIAGSVLWFAHVTAGAGAAGWETSLAQAARVLALIALATAVFATVAVLTNNSELFFGAFSLGT